MRSTPRRWRSAHAWPIAILTAVPIVLLGRAVLGLVFLGSGDALVYYFPIRWLWTRAAEQGYLPLWTDLLYAGYPLAADIQTAAFYPLNLIHLFFSPIAGHNATVIMHLALAGFFTYMLALHYGMDRRAALIAGIIFTLPGSAFSHMGCYPFSASLTWMPAVLLAVMRYLRNPSFSRGALAALVWAVQILAGFPQLVLYTGLAAGVLTAFHIAYSRSPAWRVFGGVGFIGIAAIGLSAIQILPTAEMVRLGPRTGIPYENFALGSVSPAHLLPSLISPGAMSVAAWGMGDWTSAMYGIYFVGVFPFVALILALVVKFRTSEFEIRNLKFEILKSPCPYLPWVSIACLFAVLATGGSTPLGRIMYHVPLISLFQVQARYLVVVDLAFAMLTGWALDYILRGAGSRGERPPRRALLMVIAVLAMISVSLWYLEGNLWQRAVYNNFQSLRLITGWEAIAEAALLLALAAVTAVMISLAPRLGQSGGTTLLAAGIIFPLAAFTPLDFLSIPGSTARQFINEKPPTLRAMEEHPGTTAYPGRVCTLSSYLFFSSDSWVEDYMRLALPDLNVLHGLRQIGLYGPLQDTAYNRFIGRMGNNATFQDTRFLSQWVGDVLGIRFILVQNGFPWKPDPARHKKIYDDGRVSIFQNERAMPQAWLVPREEISNFEFRPSNSGNGEEIKIIESGDGRLVLETRAEKPRFLAVGLRHYPGWRVQVDGEKRAPMRAYGFLMGTFLAPGQHHVTFDFRPASFLIGAAISALTAAALMGLLLWGRKNN